MKDMFATIAGIPRLPTMHLQDSDQDKRVYQNRNTLFEDSVVEGAAAGMLHKDDNL